MALGCLVGALGCFAVAWRSAGHRHLVPFEAQLPLIETSAVAANTAPLRSRAVRANPPVRVTIPAIGLSARVVPVGLTPAGHMEMPAPLVAGWYRWGPVSGAGGPSVLVGHVDSDHGPAVFYRLSGVRTGETVQVVRADGTTSRFTISRITVVSKAEFPARAVFGATGRPAIRLITCGGSFDTSTGYSDSLIVWGRRASS